MSFKNNTNSEQNVIQDKNERNEIYKTIIKDIESALKSLIEPEEFTNILEGYITKLRELDIVNRVQLENSFENQSPKINNSNTTTSTTTTTTTPNNALSPNSVSTSSQTLSPSVLVERINISDGDYEDESSSDSSSSSSTSLSSSSSSSEKVQVKKPKINRYSKPKSKSKPKPNGCHICKTQETPYWRKGKDGDQTVYLCNACGLHDIKKKKKEKLSKEKHSINNVLN
ncbi:hypothetical protein RB653_004223 [Dictyostelium firmibasis]|uniref:GATA-type domain-containing protein n=1 Tax=Dictyostelium firmibasis TaxID=79012 RepID=A0AAN7U5T7_9MYCE